MLRIGMRSGWERHDALSRATFDHFDQRMRVYSFTRVETLLTLRYLLDKMQEEALVSIYIDELNASFFQVRVRLFTSLSD